MNEESLRFLKMIIRQYYKNTDIPPPREFNRREFAFESFDGIFTRHISFSDFKDFRNYIINSEPRGVYYSSAMYLNPDESDMTRKKEGWLGAELIFDLDADHIEGTNNLSYEESLEVIKKDLLKLIRILMDDFGFGEEDMEIVFSGRRGYHIHIFNDRVNSLSSDARREIINYITLMNIEPERLFTEIVYGGKVDRRPWLKRFKKYLSYFAESVRENPQLLEKKLKSIGLKKPSIKKCYEELFSIWEGKSILDYIIEGNYGFVSEKKEMAFAGRKKRKRKGKKKTSDEEIYLEKCLRNIFKAVWKDFLDEYLPHPDEPVTTDISRLIRLPYTIHGKSFLRVMPVPMDELKDFNPLQDASLQDLKKINVVVEVKEDLDFAIGGERYKLSKGIHKVDCLAGVWAICLNKAEIIKYNLSEIKSLLFRY